MNPTLLIDFYKAGHHEMLPDGADFGYVTWTPRTNRINHIDKFVWFGLQHFLLDKFVPTFDEFFATPKAGVIAEYRRIVSKCLGDDNTKTSHLEALHDLQYVPIKIRALPEGSVVPFRTPVMTMESTLPEFGWLPTFLESWFSCELWQISTSATIARAFRKLLNGHEFLTTGTQGFAQFQGHDFSFRGMSSLESAISSGLGHLTAFVGTDTVPAIVTSETSYGADVDSELVGCSVAATEHSIQCAYPTDGKYLDTLLRRFPKGILSVVADGRDYWKFLTETLPEEKAHVLARDGKLVIRPDSGDPFLIICGDPSSEDPAARAGTIQLLWDLFGGTVNETGYKVLDSHIGAIYGDSITFQLADRILVRLAEMGFASTNVVFGIGSFTYQYNTRDTFGLAMKSTLITVFGEEVQVFKDPKTDSGIKKSQRGRVVVYGSNEDGWRWEDGKSIDDHCPGNRLDTVYYDEEEVVRFSSLKMIRERIQNS